MKRGKKRLIVAAGTLAFLVLLYLFLQYVWPHRVSPFVPDYAQVDLAPVLAQDRLDDEDYALLYAQTGLAPAAIDDLLAMGDAGVTQILDTQTLFFTPPGDAPCAPLGLVTQEHRYRDDEGRLVYGVPLAPLQEGDILVSLSTHTVGWRHGHAALVLDPEHGITLESVVLGTDSTQMYLNHWRSYTTLMVLRPKASQETREQVVEFAKERLDGIPYSLLSGIFGDKFQPVDGPHDAQCAYLPWYAWRAFGLDLDGNGGRIVAPYDFTLSDQVEVVQVYGFDPAQYPIF